MLVVVGQYILLNLFLAIAVDNLADAENMAAIDEEKKRRKSEEKQLKKMEKMKKALLKSRAAARQKQQQKEQQQQQQPREHPNLAMIKDMAGSSKVSRFL